jgi:hypothetical protein
MQLKVMLSVVAVIPTLTDAEGGNPGTGPQGIDHRQATIGSRLPATN